MKKEAQLSSLSSLSFRHLREFQIFLAIASELNFLLLDNCIAWQTYLFA